MKIILAAVACAALSIANVSVAAETAKPTAEAKKPDAKKDPTRMVCKKTPVTGSRFPIKACRAQQDWEAQSELDKRMVEDAQRNGLASCGTNPCS